MPVARTEVVHALLASSRLHLSAIEFYVGVAEHIERWGYPRLADRYRDEAVEERGHLVACLARLEFFDVGAAYDHATPTWPRHDYAGIIQAAYRLERAAADVERDGVLACRAVGDEQSALVFAALLEGSEDALAKLEAAQVVIGEIGLDGYLSTFA